MCAFKLLYAVATLAFISMGVALIYEGETAYLQILGVGICAYILGRFDEELQKNEENEN
jgi:hypothetical protein